VINVRSYGEDPADVARFAAAFTEGAQGAGAIATAKHFPGHGDTAVDSHRGLPEINVGRERLNTVEFVPFQAAVNAGVGAVMVGHIALPQIDSTVVKPLPAQRQVKANRYRRRRRDNRRESNDARDDVAGDRQNPARRSEVSRNDRD
jgi:beta-N-acetylhexosaminidase